MDARQATESALTPGDRIVAAGRDAFLGALCGSLGLGWYEPPHKLPPLEPDALQSFFSRNRPTITLSWAQSRTGAITRERGRPTPISGDVAGILTHVIRASHDAILVGSGTVCADDPRLDVRHWDGPHPRPVVLDTRLRTPPAARLIQPRGDRERALIVTTATSYMSHSERVVALESAGAQVACLPGSDAGGIDIDALLVLLRDSGVRSVMVEGGGQVLRSFLTAGRADCLLVTVADRDMDGYCPLNDFALVPGSRGTGDADTEGRVVGAASVSWSAARWYRAGVDAVLVVGAATP